MNTEKLQELMDVLIESARNAVETELPALAREIIVAGRIESTLWVLIGIFAAVFLGRLSFKLFAKIKDASFDAEFPLVIGGIVAGGGAIAFAVVAGNYVNIALHAWFMPRVYLVEWISGKLG